MAPLTIYGVGSQFAFHWPVFLHIWVLGQYFTVAALLHPTSAGQRAPKCGRRHLDFVGGAAATFVLTDPLHCQKISTSTATRSQVRAQGHNRYSSGSLALCIVIALLLHFNYDPVRGEGSVMGMDDGRVDAEAPTKQHAEGPRKVFEPNQTLTPKNLKRNAVQNEVIEELYNESPTWMHMV